MTDLFAAVVLIVAIAWLCILFYLRGIRYGTKMTVEVAYKEAGLWDGPVPDIRMQYVSEVAEAMSSTSGRKRYGKEYKAWLKSSGVGLRDTPTMRALWDDEKYRKELEG